MFLNVAISYISYISFTVYFNYSIIIDKKNGFEEIH